MVCRRFTESFHLTISNGQATVSTDSLHPTISNGQATVSMNSLLSTISNGQCTVSIDSLHPTLSNGLSPSQQIHSIRPFQMVCRRFNGFNSSDHFKWSSPRLNRFTPFDHFKWSSFINETGRYNIIFIDTNKVATVFGKST